MSSDRRELTAKPVSGVGVVDKSVSILDAVQTGARTLNEVVDATGLSRATAHRLASALAVHGLLRRTADGGFALGWRLVALGRAAETDHGLIEAAGPVLDALRDATGESAQLYVRDGDQRVCVAVSESPHGLRTIVGVGAVLPLDQGSAGHVLLGETSGEGWVASVAEREVGVASVSAPVCGVDGVVFAAIGVSGPIERVTRHPGERYGAAVVAAARELADLLTRQRTG